MPGGPIVGNLRLFVQLGANAVTYEGTHNRITVRLHIRLNRVGDIRDPQSAETLPQG